LKVALPDYSLSGLVVFLTAGMLGLWLLKGAEQVEYEEEKKENSSIQSKA